ncbi:hypothetical protein VCRA2121O68_150034 [Vibrio crassostreae]|nr:hypothetical protein VCRA2116O28_140034 [Vibrio crassostreae]CAK1921266.1 hypothetical protein VCRA2113O198_210107 [Vibrio crassostreae]CAK1923570.1 hypothetical protein VCRA2110O177_210103 [Vibrio crassostreae]CAK2295036.1 hypothetical protein VCRA2119O49_160034 [Vibrio crassostreae]CAK2304384.1 hypothetical protein VCRA2110O176_210103 [Vibrio crassostreae]
MDTENTGLPVDERSTQQGVVTKSTPSFYGMIYLLQDPPKAPASPPPRAPNPAPASPPPEPAIAPPIAFPATA